VDTQSGTKIETACDAQMREAATSVRTNELNLTAEILKRAVDGHAMFSVTDQNGVLLEVNDRFCALSGFCREQLVGKTQKVVNSGHHPPEFWRAMWADLSAGKPWRGVICNRNAAGDLYWVDTSVTPVQNAPGAVTHFVTIQSDVTGHLHAEERLRGVESVNAEIGRVARIGAWEMFISDMKPRWSHVTRMIHEVEAGYEPDLETAVNFYKEGESRKRISEVVQQAIESGGRWDEECQIITGAGREIWVRAIGEAEMQEGKCIRLFGTFQDIDDRKRAQLEAERLTCLMRDSVEAATEISFIATDLQGTITVFNAGSENFLGYTSEEMVGKHTPAIIHDPEEVAKRAEQLSRELGRPVSGFETFVTLPQRDGAETREWTYVRKDGSRFPVSLVVTPVRSKDGELTGFVGIATDISEKKEKAQALARREALLEKARERLSLATVAGGVGIWDFDLRSGKLEWDEQMFALYDVDPATFQEGFEDWKRCVHSDDLEPTSAAVAKAISTGKTFESEFRVVHRDGQVRHLTGMARVYPDARGEPVRMVGMNADVTKQAEQRQRLITLAREAEAANEAKSSFLANMSHEIRTPMNGIIGMTTLMLDSNALEPEQRQQAETVLTSSECLLAIINDILDVSKIEAGKMELEQVPFSLSNLLQDVDSLLSVKAQEKGLRLAFEKDAGTPELFKGDPGRLRQILFNLTGNALKFTDAGSVRVTVSTETSAERSSLETQPVPETDHETGRKADPQTAQEGSVTLRFAVADTGIGIPQEKQHGLFDSFTQADSSVTRRFGGTGLGLAISKKLSELMGGTIGVKSTPGTGSTFWFTVQLLPGAASADLSAEPATKAPLSAAVRWDARSLVSKQPVASNAYNGQANGGRRGLAQRATRILLVEDNPINQLVALAILKKMGLTADKANNGHEAINALKTSDYDLVFMDVQMPGMDGLEATKQIRALGEEMAQIPIIAMTANAREVDKLECLECGMNDYISKPIDFKQLAHLLEQWLPKASETAQRA